MGADDDANSLSRGEQDVGAGFRDDSRDRRRTFRESPRPATRGDNETPGAS
jgi:hypothetical protein